MSESTELALLPPKESALQVYTAPQGLDPYLKKIKDELDAFVPDVTTKKGRDAIASIAYKVAKGKTALDNIGKDLVAELKDAPKKIDAERKRMRDLLDLWKDEVRAPLTAWEEAEEGRKEKHKAGIQAIKDCANGMIGGQPQPFGILFHELEQRIVIDSSWEEFETEALHAKANAIASLKAEFAEHQKRLAEQAELAELRAQAAAQEQKDREERIAREAAEQARREADAQAQAERNAAAKREADAKAAAEHAALQLRLQVERAEREKVEAQRREQQAQQDAERRAAEAVAAEQRRVAAQAEAEAREARRREADRAHKGAVNRAAVAAFIQGGMTEECAKQAVTLIAKKAIPAVFITY